MTNSYGRFGEFGGQYVPETLMNELIHLEEAYDHYKKDPEFTAELEDLLNNYANRPSLLYFAKKMTEDLGGAKIYLKREDLNHTGAHNQQLPGPGPSCKEDGQDQSHRRDGGRPARRCHSDSGGSFGP